MYRAVTWKALEEGIDVDGHDRRDRDAARASRSVSRWWTDEVRMLIDGVYPGNAMRSRA